MLPDGDGGAYREVPVRKMKVCSAFAHEIGPKRMLFIWCMHDGADVAIAAINGSGNGVLCQVTDPQATQWWKTWNLYAQVEDFKAVTLKAMETQDADNQALEERLHKRMARCVTAVESRKQYESAMRRP